MSTDNQNAKSLVIAKDRITFSTQVAYMMSILGVPLVLLSITLVSDPVAAMTAASFCLLQVTLPLINRSRGFDFANGLHRYAIIISNYMIILFLSFELGNGSSLHLYYFVNICASFVYLKMDEKFMLYSSLAVGLVAIVIDFYLELNPFLNNQPIEQYQQIFSYFTITGFLLFFFVYLLYMVNMMDDVEKMNKFKTGNLQAVVRSNESLIYEIDKDYKLRNIWAADKSSIPLTEEKIKNGTNIFELFEDSLAHKIKRGVDHVMSVNTAHELQHLSESDGNWYEFKLRPFSRDGQDLRISMTSSNINHIKKIELNIDKYDAVQTDILMLMSNVIRTPLNTINTFIERLLVDNPNEKQITRLKIVKNSSDNILGLINGMIDFYRMEKGDHQIAKNEFSIFELMHRLEDVFLPEAVKNRVILRIEIDKTIPSIVIGDDEKIDQVMSNLIQNALKFTEVGKVTASVQMVKRKGNKLFLLFRVKDTGEGIVEEKQHLFNNFDNIDLSTIRQFGETGVSLAVSKLMVSVMGGNLEMHSEQDKGTSFNYILPLLMKENNEDTEDMTMLTDDGELEGHTILIADFDAELMSELRSICESWGMVVKTVGDGSGVLKELITKSYDLLIISLILPGMDGYEATSRIRASKKEKKRTMPIIAITDDLSRHLFKKVRAGGMNGFIRKPIKNLDLREVLIDVIVNKKQLINPEEELDENGNIISAPRTMNLEISDFSTE